MSFDDQIRRKLLQAKINTALADMLKASDGAPVPDDRTYRGALACMDADRARLYEETFKILWTSCRDKGISVAMTTIFMADRVSGGSDPNHMVIMLLIGYTLDSANADEAWQKAIVLPL